MDFDPRLPADRDVTAGDCYKHVAALTALCPDTSMRHLWGISPVPPDFVAEVEVETSVGIEQRVAELILCRKSVPAQLLCKPLEPDVAMYIEQETRGQADCSLWHDLHKGRITSSNFGAVYRAKKSPSLAGKILDNRLFHKNQIHNSHSYSCYLKRLVLISRNHCVMQIVLFA